jgi:hypothetical protein
MVRSESDRQWQEMDQKVRECMIRTREDVVVVKDMMIGSSGTIEEE